MATSTVGATARDYVDLAAWMADLPATLLEQEIAELYADAEFASAAEVDITGITTTASFNLVIRAAAGEAFNDSEQALRYNASNGVAIRKTSNFGRVLDVNVRYTELHDLQISDTAGNASVRTLNLHTAADDAKATNCIIEGQGTLSFVISGANCEITNSVVTLREATGAGATGIFCGFVAPAITNCTIINLASGNTSFGIERQGGPADSTVVKNCAIFGFQDAMETGTWGSGTDFNATDDSTLPAGSNNQTSLTTADQFENVASDSTLDLILKSGNDLDGNGTDTTAETGDLDIFGNDRDTDNASIGAYETAGSAGQTLTTTGIASAESFGSPVVTTGAVNLSPTGITSEESFGSPTITTGFNLSATGIASEESFGSPTLTTGAVNLTATGIASEESFGSPTVTESQPLVATGIPSEESFGSPTITVGGVTLTATGIASAESFGSPVVAAVGDKDIKIDFANEKVLNVNLQSTTLYFNGTNYFTID